MVRGCENHFRQVFINILKNAVQRTANGQICVLVALNRETHVLKVAVVDTGAGMNDLQLQLCTDMLGRLTRTGQQNSDGIGLGLLISSQLIELHQGHLSLYSDGPFFSTAVKFHM